MDFFAHQEQARRHTGLLVIYFTLGLIGLIVAIYVTAFLLFQVAPASSDETGKAIAKLPFFDWELFAGVAAATSAVVGAGSLYKSAQLAQGGEAVALMMGGRPVNVDTRDPDERKLLNVVEEMAIASGVPVPPVYLMDNEEGINAFAAGNRPTNAVIGVTRGTIRNLSRDELQGVMAHEFSHILNGDMRINTRLTGLIYGILVVSMIGYYILRSGMFVRTSNSDDRKGQGAQMAFQLFGLALFIIGYIGVFFGQLIRAAVSRQREYLADASAVQFTRNPDGIGGALKKIGALAEGSHVNEPHAPEISHMFFSTAVPQLFATHPPLADRIRRVDPNWDGKFPKIKESAPAEPDVKKQKSKANPFPLPLGQEVVMGKVGTAQPQNIATAAVILAGLTENVNQAAHEPFSAQGLIYALLLHEDPAVRERQLSYLQRELSPTIYHATETLVDSVQQMPRESRLPAMEIALASLRQLSREQYIHFRDNVYNLVQADKRITLFEYVIQLFVIRCLDEQFGIRKPKPATITDPAKLEPEMVEVLSLLSYLGEENDAEAKLAFAEGGKAYGLSDGRSIMKRSECSLSSFGQALERLAEGVPPLKRKVMSACVAVIVHDHEVTLYEYELTRAIGSVLDSPLPPLSVGEVRGS